MAEIITAGMKLKKELGLEQFRYVRISRAVISSYKILFVFYDSWRTETPITFTRIRRWPGISTILSGTNLEHGDHHKTFFTPPIDITSFNGNLVGSLIIPVNLCGDRFAVMGKQPNVKFEAVYDKNFVAGEVWPVKDSEELPTFMLQMESVESAIKLLEDQPAGEGFTIKDLIDNGESERNKKFYKLRFD